jgi:hypothetical protein
MMETREEDLVVADDVPENERPEISLHLLVKNGESVVGRLLDCVGPYVREVVAVCNDCEDGTRAVLLAKTLEHGLRRCELVEVTQVTHPELYILDVPETYQVGSSLCGEVLHGPHTGGPLLADFAAARNLGWDRCLGQWRLFLDADDVVDDPACLPGLCRALADRGTEAVASQYLVGTARLGSCAEPGSSAARAASREGLGTFSRFPSQGGIRERLCQNIPRIRWEGVVHERLVGFDPSKVARVVGSLVVRDLRDSLGAGMRAPGRNLKVLYHHARARDWEITAREMGYLAAEARIVMPLLAARLATDCADTSQWPAERAWALDVRGQVDEDVGRHDLAAEWYRKSLAEHPTAAAALRLARVCYLLGRWEEVAAAGEQARELADAPQPLDAGEVDADVVAPMVAAALCRLGRHEEASELCPRPRRS